MKAPIKFLKTTVFGGLLFLVPVVLIALLAQKALHFADIALAPITRRLPAETILGFALAQIVAVLVLLLVCFLAGLAMRTRAGARFNKQLEQMAMRRIPGFMFVKSIAQGLTGMESGSKMSVAMARMEDAWVLSFVVERIQGGLFAVFIPGAPNPASGSLYYLTEDRIRFIDIPVAKATKCLMGLGVGSRDILESQPHLVDDLIQPDLPRTALRR